MYQGFVPTSGKEQHQGSAAKLMGLSMAAHSPEQGHPTLDSDLHLHLPWLSPRAASVLQPGKVKHETIQGPGWLDPPMVPVPGGATGRDTLPEASQQVPMWARGGPWGSRAQLEPQAGCPMRTAEAGPRRAGLVSEAGRPSLEVAIGSCSLQHSACPGGRGPPQRAKGALGSLGRAP